MDEVAVVAKAVTWIPKGVWYDFFNGRRYDGGRLMELWRTIDEIPVLVKEGGIIPLKDMEEYDNSIDNPGKIPDEKYSLVIQDHLNCGKIRGIQRKIMMRTG